MSFYVTSQGCWPAALIVALLGLVLVGCGNEEGERGPPPPDSNAAAEFALDPSRFPIDPLTQHSNPIVSNNAKRAVQTIQNNNYAETANALATIASLKLEPSNQQIVNNAINELKAVATKAAEAGNQNAKYAVDYLNSIHLR